MYQALYRKWRPQTFDQVVGQSHVTETLKNQVSTGRLFHSYIFIGTRGTGKTTCARILAKAVNCHAPVDGNPCGKCPACLGIADGSVLDIVELDAASNNGVDNVRALRDEAIFSPASVKKRVYIIDEVHMLSTAAFNALLKILEEPPEHLMFILATTELQKVPATILSRCQRHSFHRIDTPSIAKHLKYVAGQEGLSLSHDAAELIARLAEGGVRDALSLLDQCSAKDHIDVEAVYSAMGLAGKQQLTEMLELILKHDVGEAVSRFSRLWMEGRDSAGFLRELSDLLRDILMLRIAPRRGELLLSGGYDMAALKSFAGRMETEELVAALETVQRYMEMLRNAKNPRTTVELCLVSLCDDSAGEAVSTLRGRIARLEARLDKGEFTVCARPAPTDIYETLDEAPPEIFEDSPPWEDEDAPAGTAEILPPPAAEPVEAPVHTAEPDFEKAVAEIKTVSKEETGSVDWKSICNKAAPMLPINLRFQLDDENKLRGMLSGSTLNIYCVPGFLYDRFNKNDVLAAFAKAASELSGREIRVLLGELKQEELARRDIEDLRAFKEVRFK